MHFFGVSSFIYLLLRLLLGGRFTREGLNANAGIYTYSILSIYYGYTPC